MNRCDLFIDHIGQLVTAGGFSSSPAAGKDQEKLEVIKNAAIAISGEKIVAAGPRKELLKAGWKDEARKHLDAEWKLALPGFVDPHTHLVFGGSREEEFLARLAGKDYLEILREGGGILSTVRQTRGTGERKLASKAAEWAHRFLEMGTTTCEAKSGYGLDLDTELKQLRAMKMVEEETGLEIIPTYLGAHAWPEEYKNNHRGYIEFIVEGMLPLIAEKKLAEYCDVFCEKGVFNRKESKFILEKAREYGFGLKLHADEIHNLGGAELAAELKATSADHLVAISEEGIKAMARAETIAVLLPGTSFMLQKEKYAPARRMIEAGVPLTLATDFNPGSSPLGSMSLIISLACMKMGMKVEEALMASTINAAHAIGRADAVGSIEKGKQADIILLDLDNYHQLPYYFGFDFVQMVIKKGKIVKGG